MIKPDPQLKLPAEIGALHFIGAGGSGMSGIARLFLAAGHRVSGSDRVDSKYLQELRELGAVMHVGHSADQLPDDVDTVVITGALWQDNPEYQAALKRGIPVLHRSQALAWLTAKSRLIAVAGAHGKTTSTGMLVSALRALGKDPSFVNGGVISELHTNSAYGKDDLFVIEADESDGSFLFYDIAIGLITNVEADHIDHYGSEQALEDAFVKFATEAKEFVAISATDPGAVAVLNRLERSRVITFGEDAGADVFLHSVRLGAAVSFVLRYQGRDFASSLGVPGLHNAVNAAGVFALLVRAGFEPQAVADALASFHGTSRRFELRGSVNGVSVFDDYAHHPTEVAAVLGAARSIVGDGRIVAVHQPHLYSRTQRLAGEFAHVLESLADFTVVLEVCGAREDPVPGVTGELVAERFEDASHVSYQPSWSGAAEFLARFSEPGDFLITLGCGDVNLLVPDILAALEGRNLKAPAS